MGKWLFFLFFELFHFNPVQSQIAKDSTFLSRAITTVRGQYLQTMGSNSMLFNGVVYEHYWNTVAGHPFFLTDQFQKGTLQYENGIYSDIPLQYDMHFDLLVSRTFLNDINLQLVSEKIKSFSIRNHIFIRVNADSSNAAFMKTGFYEVIHQGMISVLVKRENKIIRSLKTDELAEKFREYDSYYLQDEKGFHPVSDESSLISLLADQKQEMKKFLKGRNIHFKKDPEMTMVQAVIFYEQLKK